MPRVVFNEEFKTSHRYEIGHWQQKCQRMQAQYVTDGQPSCKNIPLEIEDLLIKTDKDDAEKAYASLFKIIQLNCKVHRWAVEVMLWYIEGSAHCYIFFQ